ncbi:MAG: hypothetical protein H7836_10605 [Magnetococcus sp. YQC-3]
MASSSSDGSTTPEAKTARGELPGPIAALPPDHPTRQQWEKEYRQLADGSWVKTNDPRSGSNKARRKKREQYISQLVTILFLAGIVMVGVQIYRDALDKKRQIVIRIIKQKGFELDEPTVRSLYMATRMTMWIPELDRLLETVRNLPIKTVDTLPENPEKGSYIEYIQRYDLPFNEGEALEWQARSLRKPAETPTKQ